MNGTTSPAQAMSDAREALRGILPIGATVSTMHLGTTRPRSGTSRSDVAVLVAHDGAVVNVSALVARLTGNAKVADGSLTRAVRVLGHPSAPGAVLVGEIGVALYACSTSFTHRAL